jgi:hypothetical protein
MATLDDNGPEMPPIRVPHFPAPASSGGPDPLFPRTPVLPHPSQTVAFLLSYEYECLSWYYVCTTNLESHLPRIRHCPGPGPGPLVVTYREFAHQPHCCRCHCMEPAETQAWLARLDRDCGNKSRSLSSFLTCLPLSPSIKDVPIRCETYHYMSSTSNLDPQNRHVSAS